MFGFLNNVPLERRDGLKAGFSFAIVMCMFFGVGTFFFFTVSSEEDCSGPPWNRDCVDVPIPFSERLPWLLAFLACAGIGIASALAIVKLSTMHSNLKKYVAILTGVEMMPIQQIAGIVGRDVVEVRRDIQMMIDSEMIEDFYIDYGADRVVSKKYVPKTSHKTVVTCTRCRANNEIIVGITRSCEFCREPLLLPPPPPPR